MYLVRLIVGKSAKARIQPERASPEPIGLPAVLTDMRAALPRLQLVRQAFCSALIAECSSAAILQIKSSDRRREAQQQKMLPERAKGGGRLNS